MKGKNEDKKTTINVLFAILLLLLIVVHLVLIIGTYNYIVVKDYLIPNVVCYIIIVYCLLALFLPIYFLYKIYTEYREDTLKESIKSDLKDIIEGDLNKGLSSKIEAEINTFQDDKVLTICQSKLDEIEKKLKESLELEDKLRRYRLVERIVESSKDKDDPSQLALIGKILNLQVGTVTGTEQEQETKTGPETRPETGTGNKNRARNRNKAIITSPTPLNARQIYRKYWHIN